MTPGGYHARYLRIDLTGRAAESRPLPADVLRRFLGGAGLATWLLLHESPDHVDPLGPAAPLVIAFSPLVGSPLTTSAKFTVAAKSPLTQRINDSLSSSAFAISGKKTGYDALVIVGQAPQPTTLIIEPDAVRFESAEHLWGCSSAETESRLRARLGADYRVASIGPAGERHVRFATLSHDGRHAARGGLGAVLGARRLKAIAVRGDRLTRPARPDELAAYARRLSRLSLGEGTAKYRELGTVSNLVAFNRLGTLPTRNFQEASFENAAALNPEAITNTRTRTRASCAACTIGCEHIFHRPGEAGVRLEYETLFALGPLCGVGDPDVVLSAARFCDQAGLDTISAGATVAFAMECSERGLIDAPQLRFGRGEALLATLQQIARREGIGDLLADGVRLAAQRIGRGTDEFAPHVKGLEIPGYEPRTLQTMALGFAVNARGADHNRSGAYQIDFSERIDRLNAGDEAAPLAIETEDEAAVMDSLILCKFLRGIFDDRYAAMAEMLSLVTGWDVTAAELRQTARRIVAAKKYYNIRQGWTPAEDTLPARFFEQSLKSAEGRSVQLSPERLRSQIRAYNRLRGWTDEGWLPDDALRDLALDPGTPA